MPEPKAPPKLHIYRYRFLDDLSFVRKPEEVLSDSESNPLAERIERVRKAFLAEGWEGDGEIGLIWLPPFVDVGVEDTWGTYLWHVKQDNDGISWIASEDLLTFKRLERQNEWSPWETHERVSILFQDCHALKLNAQQIVDDLDKKLSAVKTLEGSIASEIHDELLVVAQESLVSELQTFLDDGYLQILLEVFENGNRSKLRLRKVKATLDPSAYMASEEEDDSWFDIRGLVGDIVRSYKFEPFKEKLELLTRALEFTPDQNVHRELRKHVLLRNAIQHQEGQVTADVLSQFGAAAFILRDDNGSTFELKAWSAVRFSLEELKAFAKVLQEFAASLDAVAGIRVRTKYWEPLSKNSSEPAVST